MWLIFYVIIPAELARCPLQLIIKINQLFMSRKFVFYPSAVLKALGCFYSASRFFFSSIMVEDFRQVWWLLVRGQWGWSRWQNLIIAGEEEYTLWGTLLWSLPVWRRICWCFSFLSVWKPPKCSKQINNVFYSLICHFFVTALLRDQRAKSGRNPAEIGGESLYLGGWSIWESEGRRKAWVERLV